jgi:hypothetical protein
MTTPLKENCSGMSIFITQVLRFYGLWGYDEQEEEALIEQQLSEFRNSGNTAHLPPELKLMDSAVCFPRMFYRYVSSPADYDQSCLLIFFSEAIETVHPFAWQCVFFWTDITRRLIRHRTPDEDSGTLETEREAEDDDCEKPEST